jgi:hypothetical protein
MLQGWEAGTWRVLISSTESGFGLGRGRDAERGRGVFGVADDAAEDGGAEHQARPESARQGETCEHSEGDAGPSEIEIDGVFTRRNERVCSSDGARCSGQCESVERTSRGCSSVRVFVG